MKTEKQRKIILAELEKNGLVGYACQKAGVGRETYYRWLKRNDRFAKLAEEASEMGTSLITDIAESNLIVLVKKRDWLGTKYWLSHRHIAFSEKLQYMERLESLRIDNQKADNSKLGPEERELIKKAIELDFGSDYFENEEGDRTVRIYKTLAYNVV